MAATPAAIGPQPSAQAVRRGLILRFSRVLQAGFMIMVAINRLPKPRRRAGTGGSRAMNGHPYHTAPRTGAAEASTGRAGAPRSGSD
jgi:hypothetical protein